ncbi:MAG TPA: hypothetical protein PKD92_11645 [Novosphingobium sp.]|nr:hypothetical protein [Novosphingobium sp.]
MARAWRWAGLGALGLVLALAAAWFAIDSQPGRRLLAEQLEAYRTASGLSLQIGGIEGELSGRTVLRDVALRDRRGVFLSAPEVRLDWRPFALIRGHVDLRAADIPAMTLARLPDLIATPDAPLLPDLDIDIGRLQIGRLLVEPAVGGGRQVLTLEAGARIADRRAQVTLDARALEGGVAGGDRVALVLDAVPDDRRLDIRQG